MPNGHQCSESYRREREMLIQLMASMTPDQRQEAEDLVGGLGEWWYQHVTKTTTQPKTYIKYKDT